MCFLMAKLRYLSYSPATPTFPSTLMEITMSKPAITLNRPVRITSIRKPDAFANKVDRAKLVGKTGHFISFSVNPYKDNSLAGEFVFPDGTSIFFYCVFVKAI